MRIPTSGLGKKQFYILLQRSGQFVLSRNSEVEEVCRLANRSEPFVMDPKIWTEKAILRWGAALKMVSGTENEGESMPRTRKDHPPSLKAKVAIEAIKADLPVDKSPSWLEISNLRFSALGPMACRYDGEFVIEFTLSILAVMRAFFRPRSDMALKILALRRQLAVLKRKRPRPPLHPRRSPLLDRPSPPSVAPE
jgi:hypothetical protein